MIKIEFNYSGIILFLILTTVLLYGQDKQSFYFNLNASQEYLNNLYRLPDSLKKTDYRFNSFARFGYQKDWPETKGYVNVYYENRFRRYYKYQTYNRMEHILFGHGYLPFWSFGRLIINERLHFRNYSQNHDINSLLNIFSIYLRKTIAVDWQLNSGYRLWLKHYPNTSLYQDYLSHRLFINFYFALNRKSKFGLQNEFNWHQGNLYPYGAPKAPGANLNGFRFTTEISGSQIIREKFFIDLRYRFEWDSPQDISNQQNGEHFGDENTEEILAEDSDFDYVKHQLSSSLLYKAAQRLSFFGFAVLQTKRFQHWQINENGPLRSDIFGYLSLTAKYRLHKTLFAEIYFNLENNHSNYSYYQYSRQIVGAGLRYKF